MKSIVNGSGLQNSVAGEVSKFSIFLRDIYDYPSPFNLITIRVEITLPLISLDVDPHIYPVDPHNGIIFFFSFKIYIFIYRLTKTFRDVTTGENEEWERWNSDFEVFYTPEKSGLYEIRVYCGSVPLNGGNPFTKFVSPGIAENLTIV